MTVTEKDELLAVLRELYDARLLALNQRMDDRFHALEKAVEIALEAQQEARRTALAAVADHAKDHAIAHDREHETTQEQVARDAAALNTRLTDRITASDIAQDKFEATVTGRFDETNKWRSLINDRESTFARDADLDKEAHRLDAVIDRVDQDGKQARDRNTTAIEVLGRTVIGMQASLAELTQVAADVRELRQVQSIGQGKGLVTGVIVSSVIALLVSLTGALILYALTRK